MSEEAGEARQPQVVRRRSDKRSASIRLSTSSCARHESRAVIMKKHIICLLISTLLASAASAQQVLNLDSIPDAAFPCCLVKHPGSENEVHIDFSTPAELSKYCSRKAQKRISNAQTDFWVGAALQVVGATFMQAAQGDSGFIFGCIALAGGSVCELAAISNVIGHFKWDYRRKQVDLYLAPNGAALRF